MDEPEGTTWGLGDFNPEIFFSIELPLGFSLGPGFTVVTPTATDSRLGGGKLDLGPALVFVWSGGPALVGVLATDAVSVAGDDARPDMHQMLLQPFVSINLPLGTYVNTAPQMLFDWENEAWTVPIGGGVGQTLKLGPQPVNFGVQAYWNAVHPDPGPTWSVRTNFQLMFPVTKRS